MTKNQEESLAEAASTRPSLLLRLRDDQDAEAWEQFVEIYSPLVFHFGRRCGLQNADAADLLQDVLSEVNKSIGRFDYDPQIGRFRSWLYKVTKRSMLRMRDRQRRQPVGAADSTTFRMLENLPSANDELIASWDREYRDHLIEWASRQIRHQFSEETWQAFWSTAVHDQAASHVAERLGMSVGAVYVARSRVLKRLGQKIREIDAGQ